MQLRLTKTFLENRWFRRESPGVFTEIPREETKEVSLSLDAQIKQWVTQTGNLIIHPGQLGMHTVWHGSKEDQYQLKCVTLGLTVLYVEPANVTGQQPNAASPRGPIPHPDFTGAGADPGNAPTNAGTGPSGARSDNRGAINGRGSSQAPGCGAVPADTGENDAPVTSVGTPEAPASTSTVCQPTRGVGWSGCGE